MTMLPITSLYAALLALLLLVLSIQVSRARGATRTNIGLGDDIRLLRASRAQGNFVEYVPMLVLLLLLLEVRGTGTLVLHALGAAVVLGRIAHAWGIAQEPEQMIGRMIGIILTYLPLLIGAVLLLVSLV
ncbi:MAG: glutathione metabolism protein [Rubritepida sp.]|nr:glutathione metabolism protein [Rubritepida sp.]